MDPTLHQELRHKVHGAARDVTRALTAGDAGCCQAALARAEAELQVVAATLHCAAPEVSLRAVTLDDVDVKGRALRRLAERLAAELYARRPPAARRAARWRVMFYLLVAGVVLFASMGVGELRRWVRPEGLRVTYYGDTNLQEAVWLGVEIDLARDFHTAPAMPWLLPGGFSSRWTGYLDVPREDDYVFYCQSSDGIRFYVDGQCCIENWRQQAFTTSGKAIKLHLTAGLHPLKVEHYTHTWGGALRVRWSGGGIPDNTVLAAPYLRRRL